MDFVAAIPFIRALIASFSDKLSAQDCMKPRALKAGITLAYAHQGISLADLDEIHAVLIDCLRRYNDSGTVPPADLTRVIAEVVSHAGKQGFALSPKITSEGDVITRRQGMAQIAQAVTDVQNWLADDSSSLTPLAAIATVSSTASRFLTLYR